MEKKFVRFFYLIVILSLFSFTGSCKTGDMGDEENPTVSITSPQNGATVNGIVTIQADASDNVGVFKVVFYVNDTKIGEDSSAPYSMVWNAAQFTAGDNYLRARAWDTAGNESDSVIVTVTNNSVVGPFLEDFNKYDNGTVGLNAGDIKLDYPTWVASGMGDSILSITDEPVSSGKFKCLHFVDAAAANDTILARAITGTFVEGTFSFDLYVTSSSYLIVSLGESVSEVFTSGPLFGLAAPGMVTYIIYDDGGATYSGGSISHGAWMTVSVKFNTATDTYTLLVNGSTIRTPIAFANPLVTVNAIEYFAYDTAGYVANLYIDNIRVEEGESGL